MHDPAKIILFQDPYLKNHIDNKDLDQCEKLQTENCSQEPFDGCGESSVGRGMAGTDSDIEPEPVGYLVDHAQEENDKWRIERDIEKHEYNPLNEVTERYRSIWVFPVR